MGHRVVWRSTKGGAVHGGLGNVVVVLGVLVVLVVLVPTVKVLVGGRRDV
jgi:hypothetical protein